MVKEIQIMTENKKNIVLGMNVKTNVHISECKILNGTLFVKLHQGNGYKWINYTTVSNDNERAEKRI